MAVGAGSEPHANGNTPSSKPIELSIGLPRNPGTRVYLHLTILATSIVLFLTSSAAEAGPASASLGSFVYAIPDRYNLSQPMSTPLYNLPSSIEFATRMAKVLVRKTKMPCYVGSSVSFSGAAGGGTVDEEIEGFRAVIEVVLKEVDKASAGVDEI